jgi:glyceraldehyde 3-phosphate dehydrogenase
MLRHLYIKEVSFQVDRRRAGVELIKIVSDLWYDKSIEMVLFKNQLLDKNVSDIINLHHVCRRIWANRLPFLIR